MKRMTRTFATLMAIAALFAMATGAEQRPVDSVLRDFIPSGEFTLQVDGEEVPGADIYFSQRAGSAFLIRSSVLPAAVLVEPRGQQVRSVPTTALAERTSGAVDIYADAELTPRGAFERGGDGHVTFSIGGERVRMNPRPDILGLHDTGELLDYSAGYAYAAGQYDPSGPMLRALRRTDEPARVRVYFGYWCPHCREVVPRMLRVATELEGAPIEFEYVGLPERFANERVARENDITAVPTAVVFRDGREVGRIESTEWKIPELALHDILK